jgi:lysophospholipase L1-like esterase
MPPEQKSSGAAPSQARLRRLLKAVANLGLVLLSLAVGLWIIEQVLRRYFTTTHFIEPEPRFGWTHIPGQTGYDVSPGEYRVPFAINSHGLNDQEYTYRKPPGTYRILVLGDSFTEATHVHQDEAYHAGLEANLNDLYATPIEVINAGVRGFGMANELLYYTHEGHRYQPDLVIVGFFIGNDFSDSYLPFSDTLQQGYFPYYTLEDGELVLHNFPGPGPPSTSPDEGSSRVRLEDWQLWNFLGNIALTWPPTLRLGARTGIFKPPPNDYQWAPPEEQPADVRQAWDLTAALILALRDEVAAHDAELLIVFIPPAYEVDLDTWDFRAEIFPQTADWDPLAPNRRLGEFLESQNIAHLDLQPALYEYAQTHAQALYYARDRGHWTPLGHRLAGEAIQAYILEHGYLSGLTPAD